MYSISRDNGFYKSPVVKSLLVISSASSLLYYILAVRHTYPVILLVVRVWTPPSPGLWLAGAIILYYSRVLERRTGSSKFINYLLSSSLFTSALLALLGLTSEYTGLLIKFDHGAIMHALVGMLAVKYMTSVIPTHTKTLVGLNFSSNIPFYVLTSLFSFYSINSSILTLTGMFGGLLSHVSRFSLPFLPSWIESLLGKVVGGDTPPIVYSGASLQVQRQQRTDEVERMMNEFYAHQQRTAVRIGRPVRAAPPQPSEEQLQQLIAMGFSRADSSRALIHTGNNVQAAIQLLTARHTQ